MHVEKEARRVSIVCRDGVSITGTVHINPGERVIDFLNDPKEAFIVVTNSEFRGFGRLMKRKKTVFILKNAMKWMEEV